MTADPTSYENNLSTINAYAWKVLRRVHAAGWRHISLEDVQQELGIAWMRANKSYNPQAGAAFKTYLYQGMRLHVNAWLRSEAYSVGGSLSLDETSFGAEGDDGSLHEVIAAPGVAQDEELVEKQTEARVMARLSPLSQLVLRLLQNPPDLLVQEFRAMRAKYDYARERGMIIALPTEISLTVIFMFLGLSRTLRGNVRREIKEAVERTNGWKTI